MSDDVEKLAVHTAELSGRRWRDLSDGQKEYYCVLAERELDRREARAMHDRIRGMMPLYVMPKFF